MTAEGRRELWLAGGTWEGLAEAREGGWSLKRECVPASGRRVETIGTDPHGPMAGIVAFREIELSGD